MSKPKAKALTPAPDLAEMVRRCTGHPRPSGSNSGDLTYRLLNQFCGTQWVGSHPERRTLDHMQTAVRDAMIGIGPRDPLEGLLAAQMVATHEAALECYRQRRHHPQGLGGRMVPPAASRRPADADSD